jgi:hypothetical protein
MKQFPDTGHEVLHELKQLCHGLDLVWHSLRVLVSYIIARCCLQYSFASQTWFWVCPYFKK